MTAIYEKELRAYFSGMTGYVFVSALLLLCGVMTAAVNLAGGLSAFENTLYTVSYVFLFTVPLLTMGVGADERKNKTDVLLRALPLSPLQIVMGKYLALITIFALPCGVMSLYPPILSTYGGVNYASAYGSLLGFFLLGAALLAFGMMISLSLDSPVIAGVVTFFSLLFMFLLGEVGSLFTGSVFASLLSYLCVYDRFTVFLTGMFDLSGIVYFITITALCLIFSVQIRYGRDKG